MAPIDYRKERPVPLSAQHLHPLHVLSRPSEGSVPPRQHHHNTTGSLPDLSPSETSRTPLTAGARKKPRLAYPHKIWATSLPLNILYNDNTYTARLQPSPAASVSPSSWVCPELAYAFYNCAWCFWSTSSSSRALWNAHIIRPVGFSTASGFGGRGWNMSILGEHRVLEGKLPFVGRLPSLLLSLLCKDF